MKKLLLILLIAPFFSFAQPLIDTTLYNDGRVEVETILNDSMSYIVTYESENDYKDGIKKEEGAWLVDEEDRENYRSQTAKVFAYTRQQTGVWKYFQNGVLVEEITHYPHKPYKWQNNKQYIKTFYKNGTVKSEGFNQMPVEAKHLFEEVGNWKYYDQNSQLIREEYYLRANYKKNPRYNYKDNRNNIFTIYHEPSFTFSFNEDITIEDVKSYFNQKNKLFEFEGVYSGTIQYNHIFASHPDFIEFIKVDNNLALIEYNSAFFFIPLSFNSIGCNNMLDFIYFSRDKNTSNYHVEWEDCKRYFVKSDAINECLYKHDYKGLLMNELMVEGKKINFETILVEKSFNSKGEQDLDYFNLDLYKSYNPNKLIKTDNGISLPIRQSGNMKFITISIGGKEYEYLIDTGASDMIINSEIERHLLSLGILRKEDYTVARTYEIANGEKIQLKRAKLYSMSIEGYQFNDIEIAIGGENSSLLLGMSFLNKFDWKFNGNSIELMNKGE